MQKFIAFILMIGFTCFAQPKDSSGESSPAKNKTLKYSIIGGCAGLVLGAVIASLVTDNVADVPAAYFREEEWPYNIIGAAIGTPIGMIIGYTIGKTKTPENHNDQ